MSSLTPGVTTTLDRVSNAEQAAFKVVELAHKAVAAGSFGVGGFLMDRSGQVLAEAVNAVIRDGEVQDPTAHAERQLVDWLFAARARGLRIPASDLIIVSSLDPCAMCAGAILSAGLSVVALATDSFSGVHAGGFPHRMPRELWARAESTFGLFKVAGRLGRADRISPILSGYAPTYLFDASELAFQQSLQSARAMIAGSEAESDQCKATPIISSETLKRLAALTDGLADTAFIPTDLTALWDLPSSFLSDDGAALVDEEGAVLLAAKGREQISPARSSVLELIRAYVRARNLAESQLQIPLPHQRRCSVIKLRPPHAPEKMLMELGALGSFFEDMHLAHGLPSLGFLDPERTSEAVRWAASLPPFYRSFVRITVGYAGAALA
jgi:tRNA(Arg) A34 adenosine deaminase TadA